MPTSLHSDTDAERALVGLCVQHGAAALDLARDLGVRGGDFSREPLKAIWQAVWRLRAEDRHVDAVTVCDELRRAGHLEAVGGPAAVAQLAAHAVHAQAADGYARIVREQASLRRLREVCRIIADDAEASRASASQLLTEAQAALSKLQTREGSREPLARARIELSAQGIGADQVSQPLAFLPAAELATRTFPATPWLVRGLLTQRALFVVGGEPKTTKTWAAIELGMAIATGTKAFGEFATAVEPAPVALFLAEDSEQATRNRLRALAASRSMRLQDAARRIYHRNLAPLDITREDDLARLVAGVRELPEPPAALILDPLRDLHTADENDSTAMSRVMHALRALRSVLGCAVVFVHHAAKASESSKSRRPGQRMRGSSVVHGAVDGGLYLTDLTGNLETEWTNTGHVEVKAARGAGSFSLTLRVEDDADGEAVRAEWGHKSGAAKAAMSDADLIVAVLQALDDQNPRGWHSTEAIREGAGKKKPTVTRILYELASGTSPMVERGLRGGWRLAALDRSWDRSGTGPAGTGTGPGPSL